MNVDLDLDPRDPEYWRARDNARSSAVIPKVSVDDMKPYAYLGQTSYAPAFHSLFDGDKFPGGFGPTQIQHVDYWTLRMRSAQLFNENLYARGLIRRLVTNEINIGLTPEACPDEQILGLPEDSLTDWSENVENRFIIWGKSPGVCDWQGVSTFGELQRTARREALIEGDVLVVLRHSKRTRLPMVQLVNGSLVRSPLDQRQAARRGNKIEHGVELDNSRRVVAYWVTQDDGSSKRMPAVGEKSGRRIAWLAFGTDKRMDEVRGQPILALVMQSLKEIDRYRDSAQRKAVINSILAMFIRKGEDKPGTLPVTGGAVRKNTATVSDNDGGTREFTIANQVPGMVMQELQTGEEPVGFGSQGTDTDFGVFEEAIVQSIAWANELPPEILRLAFSNNYSASQAAINEFKIYLIRVWTHFGETFCTPIYLEWLVGETLLQNISAPGLIEAWRNKNEYATFGAWTMTDWYGSVKPSTDMVKQGKAAELLIAMGLSTHAREARGVNGSKFSKNVKRLKRENELMAEAKRPLAEFNQEFGLPQESEVEVKAEALLVQALEAHTESIEDEQRPAQHA